MSPVYFALFILAIGSQCVLLIRYSVALERKAPLEVTLSQEKKECIRNRKEVQKKRKERRKRNKHFLIHI
jgi:antitoxin component of RelBE/YafQ-DinJ toxin-antitoxin module